MQFSEAVAEEARRFSKTTDDKKFVALAKPLINLAYLDVGKSWEWPQLLTAGSILAIPIVTGSVGIASGSQTVQITGADATYKGRYFRVQGGSNNYRIMYVSGTTVYLEQPIVEASGTVTFEIEKRYYTLPTEVRRIVSWDKNERSVVSLDNQGLRQNLPNRSSPFSDVPFQIHGVDDFTADYSQGLISTSADNSATVTGDGTQAFLSNAQAGNIITISAQDYRIKRVETDNQLVLYNKIEGKISNLTYTISIDSALTLRPYADFLTKKVISFRYIRGVYDLVNDADRIYLSNEAKLAVLDFAEANIKQSIGADGWENVLAKAQARLESAQANARPINASFKMFAVLVPTGLGRR